MSNFKRRLHRLRTRCINLWIIILITLAIWPGVRMTNGSRGNTSASNIGTSSTNGHRETTITRNIRGVEGWQEWLADVLLPATTK